MPGGLGALSTGPARAELRGNPVLVPSISGTAGFLPGDKPVRQQQQLGWGRGRTGWAAGAGGRGGGGGVKPQNAPENRAFRGPGPQGKRGRRLGLLVVGSRRL
jgi:hypothetical protein